MLGFLNFEVCTHHTSNSGYFAHSTFIVYLSRSLTCLSNRIDQSVWFGKISPVGDVEFCIHWGASTALENVADSHQSMTITLYEQPFIPLLVLKHLKVYNYTNGLMDPK